ncbi:MAG: glycosyltransferase family 4 protein [Ginsengibacter sp.]
MKSIIIISAVFPPEPVVSANLSYDIACSLSERNKVTVLSPKPSRPFGFDFANKNSEFSFKHCQIDSFVHASSGISGRVMESYSFGKHCYRYITDDYQNIDVIYANTWPLLGQYFALKAARKYNIPIIIHVQDIYPESLTKKLSFAKSIFTRLLLPLDKYILGKASAVIAISQKMKNYLVKSRKLFGEKITVIPNWQDEESFLNYQIQGKNACGPFTFMYLGNIGPVAGVDLLLKAFAKAHLKNTRLIIAGSGTMKERLMKDAENISDNMIEFWSVPDGKVPEIQGMSDVMMLPVKKGNAATSIPSKLPAYMFSSRPVIACVEEDSDVADIINDAKCGFVVEPENVESLTVAMQQVYNMEKSKLEKLGMNGREYALLNLSKKTNLQKVVSVIESLIDGDKKD